jgi:hypothetical protein
MRSALLPACLTILLIGLAACSETTLRRDSLSFISIGDQDLVVSWVEVPPDAIDLMVGAASREDAQPLDRATAIAAAGRVAARRCLLDRVHAAFAPIEYTGGRFAFRYVCGGSAAPPPPPMDEDEESD